MRKRQMRNREGVETGNVNNKIADRQNRIYRRCTRCVMDTTDPKITFDADGVCDHCRNFDKNILPHWKPQENRYRELMQLAKKIRRDGRGKKYDCILGLSGGADSSYMAYLAKEVMHLRPLAFAVDTGWNLDLADGNIEKMVKGLGMDLHTEVIDQKEMNSLQLAYFQSSISSCDQPQDHAIFAALYRYVVKHKIKYVLTGSNNSTEFIRPPVDWIYMNDIVLMKDIQKKYGRVPLKTYPMCGMLRYRIFYERVLGMQRVFPLDYVAYDKEKANRLLQRKYGWTKYENKHYENIFTRFFEGYYLPKKFGYDTRKNVLSNQILAGTVTREEAVRILETPPYDPAQMQRDKAYIAQKMGITAEEFDRIIARPPKTPRDYKNMLWLIRLGVWVSRRLGVERRNIRV